jgi:hypothetical protein
MTTALSSFLSGTYTGYTGSRGFTGSRGTDGIIGFNGSVGFTGSRGDTGFTGSQGDSGRLEWLRITENYTAVSQQAIIADTSGGTFTVTLPATPVLGEYVVIVDGANWQTTNLTIARNGSTIEGFAEDLVLDVGNVRVDFIYDGSTWEVFSSVGQTGFTGSAGPSNIINATDDTSATTHFPVFVAGTGNQTAKIRTTSQSLSYTPSTGILSSESLNISGTGAIKISVGTTGQRPTPATGQLRFNSDLSKFEGYNGLSWSSVGGGATGGGSDEVFVENGQVVTTSYTLSANKNAMSVGPITLNDGVEIVIPDGASWVVL